MRWRVLRIALPATLRRSGRTGVVAARAQRERVEAQREDATYNMPAEVENEILRRCW